ncbi:MAG: hypothetical protein LBL44_00340 [Treponema sp.]|nr:hypothetical protein [Treponema sp.]
MSRNTRSLFFMVLLVLKGAFLPGETVAPFVMPQARFSGMGGIHAALGDDFYSLFTNPASFVGVEDQFSVSELTVSMYGPVFEILDLAVNKGSLKDLDLSAGIDAGGPLALGWVGRGLGLGVFNRFTGNAAVSSGISLDISGEAFFVAGYSFRALEREKHVLDAGFLGKGFFRNTLDLKPSLVFDGSVFDNAAFFKTFLGMGLDLGVKYTYGGIFTAALSCFDAFSPALVTAYASYDDFRNGNALGPSYYGSVDSRLGLGFSYRVSTPFLDRYVSKFLILADYRDFLNLFDVIPRNPILNVSLGAELVILERFSLRAGIADALPAAGFGIDLSFMKLDFSIYGRELGLDPGIDSVYAVDVGLLFRY